MLELIEGCKGDNLLTTLRSMKPLQIATFIGGAYNGEIIMRTASEDTFEVMSISKPSIGRCWSSLAGQRVRLLRKGESVTVKIFNE